MENNLQQAINNRQALASIKKRYDSGEITREQAKAEATPIINTINEQSAKKTKELNAKYNMKRKPYKLDFINAMRNSY